MKTTRAAIKFSRFSNDIEPENILKLRVIANDKQLRLLEINVSLLVSSCRSSKKVWKKVTLTFANYIFDNDSLQDDVPLKNQVADCGSSLRVFCALS